MDYPRNVIEFEEFFPDEEAAHRYLEGLRWPEGFHCPRCAETTAAWRSGRRLLICAACRQQISVTAGTLFDKTRKPLRSWFHVAWEIMNAKQGVNALTMRHRLGLRSYQTAWSWLHKFRRAMVRPDRDRLTGEVEVDEAYVGGEETGVRGRQTKTKSIVLIAVEVRGDRHGRIRLRHVPDVSGKSLAGFVKDAVERDSVVKTDGWSGYSGLTTHHYAHQVTTISSSGDPAVVVMPNVHLVVGLLKRWLLGTLPRGRQPRAPRLLLGRVHLSLQPPDRAGPGAAVLPASGTGRSDPPRSSFLARAVVLSPRNHLARDHNM